LPIEKNLKLDILINSLVDISKTMKRVVDDSRFFILELICLTVSAALWIVFPKLSWQPLFVLIAPLFIRGIARTPVFVRTPFDVPVLIFLITAGIGIWTAYQSANAWIKFWLILIAVLAYYSIARQPEDNLWIVAGLLSLMGLGISFYFFLSNNWEVQQIKFQVLNQIGIAWMHLRPDLPLTAIHPNDVAGLTGLSLPFSIALMIRYFRRKSILACILFGLAATLSFITIIMSSSRGAWMALFVTIGLWLLWELINRSKYITKRSTKSLFILLVFGSIIVLTFYVWVSLRGRLIETAIGLPNVSVADQRYHVFLSDFELIRDVPITGGGLDSFPGLYSNYILLDPNYILGYGHNIFLDATLQQGILGGMMLIWIYLGSVILLFLLPTFPQHNLLRFAIISSLLIIIVHGQVDDLVYRSWYVPLAFLVPGMAVSLARLFNPKPITIGRYLKNKKVLFPAISIIALVFSGLILFKKPFLSAWFTDLGAVEMAKVELSNFPTGTWDEGQHVDLLFPAESLFNRALSYQPDNPQANYRLGLINMQNRDFSSAVAHLQIAYLGDPYHRGIIKALGLSYVWNGQIEGAIPLLSLIPESSQELSVYSWWWREQNRPDLAAQAQQYLTLAESGKK
jgi:O-antigen ligase